MAGTRSAADRRRVGVSRMHRRGRDAQRVLLVGDRSFVAGGGAQGERLADLVADRVTSRTGRGLDLDVVWDLAPVMQAVGSATEAWRLWRYEVVVVLARDPPARQGGWSRSARVGRLVQRVIGELSEASRVLLVHLRVPDSEDRGVEEVAEQADGERGVISSLTMPITAAGGLLELPARADAIAERVFGLLRTAQATAETGGGRTAPERRAEPEPEADRQRAVDRTSEAMGGLTPHLERVVLLARNTFDVPFAQVNLLDHGHIRTLAFVGAPGDSAEQPICTITVRGSGPTIIADTWADHRLDANPHVHNTDYPVRFYAAHPIESIDGYRIGTLCVFDLKPHDVSDLDPSVLRDLALLAEAEISTLPVD